MSHETSEKAVPIDSRQAIFKALVESQDEGMSVGESRAAIALQFSVTTEEVKDIEKEGLANQWPPL
jgi:hypothetical protein